MPSESGSLRLNVTGMLKVGFGDPPTDGVMSVACALPASTGATSKVVPFAFRVRVTTVGAAPGTAGFDALT